jgi:hypothetical protein
MINEASRIFQILYNSSTSFSNYRDKLLQKLSIQQSLIVWRDLPLPIWSIQTIVKYSSTSMLEGVTSLLWAFW